MKTENATLANRYHALSSEELLKLAADKDQLTEDARNSLEDELRQRNLEASTTQPIEPEEVIEPAEPQTVAETQLTELPDDFFKDDEPLTAVSVASRRPKGITLIAFVATLNAFWSAFFGLILFPLPSTLGPAEGYPGAPFLKSPYQSSILNLAIALFGMLLAIGLFRMRRWSLVPAILWYGVNALTAGITIAVAGITLLRGGSADPVQTLLVSFKLVYCVLFVRYLLSPPIQRREIWID